MNISVRRLSTAAITTTVLAGLTVALPGTAGAAPPYDPAPAPAAASWMAGELENGLVPGQFGPEFPDYGLTIDAAVALIDVGGQDAAVAEADAAIQENLDKYISYAFQDDTEDPPDPEPDFYGDVAGSTAKAAVLADLVGADPESYADVDLIERLESLTSDAEGTQGRIFDTAQDQPDYAYANTLGQSFAVRALTRAGSLEAAAATSYLIAQQCDEGFFRLEFSGIVASDQTCDGAAGAGSSTDATALAVLALLERVGDPQATTAIQSAVAWLKAQQATDGSFGSDASITTPNANSTGLAGWALGEVGEAAAAERAAVFVRSLQADDPAPCTTSLSQESGAIAYDGAARQSARTEGITDSTSDQWRRTTAQALPALQWAPLNGTGPVANITTSGYFQGGSTVRVGADGVAPGDTVCFSRNGSLAALAPAGTNGQALARVTLPAGTKTRTFAANAGQEQLDSLSFDVLGAKKLKFDLKPRVVRGKQQRVEVRGLAPRERVKVRYRGARVDVGDAGRGGRFIARFPAGRKVGQPKVTVVGEFDNRTNSKAFRIVRSR